MKHVYSNSNSYRVGGAKSNNVCGLFSGLEAANEQAIQLIAAIRKLREATPPITDSSLNRIMERVNR